MATINFPASPSIGQRYPATGDIGGVYYKWDGASWIANTFGPFSNEGDLLSFDGTDLSVVSPGLNGQILSVNTGVSGLLEWTNPPAGFTSPLNTAGDLMYNQNGTAGEASVLAAGADGQILSVDFATTGLLKWINPPQSSPLTTKGDIYAFDTADGRFPVSPTNDYALLSDSTQPFGLKWGPVPTSYQQFNIIGGNPVLYRPVSGDLLKWVVIPASSSNTTTIEVRTGGGQELNSVPIGWQCVLDNQSPNDIQIVTTEPSDVLIAEFAYIPANFGTAHIVKQSATEWRVSGDLIDV